MKLMVIMLCVVLWCVDVAGVQENDWLSGTWKGIRKLESLNLSRFVGGQSGQNT
jgi:hypothetical protein